MPAKKPITSGTRFGRLVAVQLVPGSRPHKYLCICDCGNYVSPFAGSLRCGDTKSCGCLRNPRGERHGNARDGRRTGAYGSWLCMRYRCQNPNDRAYPNYGGRGISVCPRWDVFENFLADMGERPAGTSIDRIDPDGNYEPSNCRWATSKQQHNNRTNNRRFEINGVLKTVSEWCDEVGANRNIVYGKLRCGKPFETALKLGTK